MPCHMPLLGGRPGAGRTGGWMARPNANRNGVQRRPAHRKKTTRQHVAALGTARHAVRVCVVTSHPSINQSGVPTTFWAKRGCFSAILFRGLGIDSRLRGLVYFPKNFAKFWAKSLFTSQKILQNFSDSPSHRIFRHIHEVLNIDKNKN